MAKVPLVDEQAIDDFVVLNFEKVALSDEQFIELCADNEGWICETTDCVWWRCRRGSTDDIRTAI